MILRGAALAVAVLLLLAPAAIGQEAEEPAGSTSEVKLRLEPRPVGARHVWLESNGEGGLWFVLERSDGGRERLRPEEFAERLDEAVRGRPFAYRLLNITSPVGIAWVVLGLLGQVLFAGRMIIQWIVSERSRRSVVPVLFWWMSLGGATMLLVYFVWRRDIVGVLGQSTGWVIYTRNLWLIHRERASAAR